MKPYHEWFEDAAEYQLPDGTDVQAIWAREDGSVETHTPPAFGEVADWLLVPFNAPGDGWHQQWLVRVDGALVEQRSLHVKPKPQPRDDLPTSGVITIRMSDMFPPPLQSREWVTDMTIDDVRRVEESQNQ